ncbi:hypothetical protein EYV94_15335 [Puteibacter caeruleilacunae]|nr:hypothetical protein EYV94_15335 [Puteibacter caeruleilacunae]
MKQVLILILTIFTSSVFSQTRYIDGTGFNSAFQQIKRANYYGSVKGRIMLKKGTQCDTINLNQPASLEIIPDKNEIYDVSKKTYIVKTNDFGIRYSTYCLANELVINKNNLNHQISMIDGGCDLVIPGLKWYYIQKEESEILVLFITDDISLSLPGTCGEVSQILKAGSLLEWRINNQNDENN